MFACKPKWWNHHSVGQSGGHISQGGTLEMSFDYNSKKINKLIKKLRNFKKEISWRKVYIDQ